MALYVSTIAAGGLCLLFFWAWSHERDVGVEVASRTDGVDDEGDSGPGFDELPETPTREEVLAILRKLTPYVRACGTGKTGVVRIHVSIAGKTGAVTDASVIKQFAGTELADCATRIVERAQFPRFRKKVLTVVYPVSLPGTAGDASTDVDGGADAG